MHVHVHAHTHTHAHTHARARAYKCKIQEALSQGHGYHIGWHQCGICKQPFSGKMRLALAEDICRRYETAVRNAAAAVEHCEASTGLGTYTQSTPVNGHLSQASMRNSSTALWQLSNG